jgi:hypothetical protein
MIGTSLGQQLLTNLVHLSPSLQRKLYLLPHLFCHLQTINPFSFNDIQQVIFFQPINYLLKSFHLHLIFLKEIIVKILFDLLFFLLKVQFLLLNLRLSLLKG